MNENEKLLDELAYLMSHKDAVMLQKQDLVNSVLTVEIKAKLAEIDTEFEPELKLADAMIASMTDKVKAAVLAEGDTVKCSHLMAVYNKPRVTWDSKKLDGMMALVPGLAAARKEGEPTVSIRKL